MKNIYYIAELDFENANASTSRVINNIKSLQMNSDVNVTIIGYGNTPELIVEGINVVNLPKGNSNIIKFLHYVFRSIDIFLAIRNFNKKPDTIIYYGSHSRYLIPLLIQRKALKFSLFSDVVEWYEYKELPMGRFGFPALDVHLGMTKLIPQCDGIITISSFLKNYYEQEHNHKRVIQIPVTLDTKKIIKNEEDIIKFAPDYLNLIYAGVPGKKDILLNVIEAVNQLSTESYKIRFHLIGCSKDVVLSNNNKTITENVIFLGRMEQTKIANYLSKADFSILLRPDKRFAHAGFSTKFVESLNAGLPVIANLTSDVGKYLIDGENGFIIKDYDDKSIISFLRQILLIPKNELGIMRLKSKKTAEDFFDYRIYSNIIYNFIN